MICRKLATGWRSCLMAAALLSLAGCSSPGEPGLKVIVGGRLEPGLDQEPIPRSVVVIQDGKIRAAGPQASTPVPKGAETIDGSGKLIQPMPYNATIAPGNPANLMIRDAESGAPERIMQDGDWVQ
jgi:hypothetical protein